MQTTGIYGLLNQPIRERVNNDGAGNDQRLPWICVDKVTGYIWIIFYDSRNNATTISNPYVARSTDGGNTFQNVKISSSNIINSFYMGEYMGIDAYNNKVRPLWGLPSDSYIVQSYVTIIDTFYTIGINTISEEIPSAFSLKQNYPNPFNPATKIKFAVSSNVRRQTSDVKLIIYDVTGREVTTLVDQTLNPGTYEITFDASMYSSGVYFYRLTADRFTDIKKMLLVK